MQRNANHRAEATWSVGKVARLAGVTIRTLHHYGEIGLLVPSGRTPAGYRQYSGEDLDRLSRILFYRELGFSLDDIATMLDDPTIDRVEHLRRQRGLLDERMTRLKAMAAAVDKELEAAMTGINLTSEEKLEVFGPSYNEDWEKEAEERWGDTDAWKQSQERSASYSKADWERFTAEMNALHQQLVTGFNNGLAPDSEEAMNLAEAHRQWLNTQMDCSPDFHRCIVDMYLADERFTKTYEDMASGLTQWLHDAAYANADRMSAEG